MMQQTAGLTVAVTGAAGFIGRSVVDRIDAGALGRIAELRLNDLSFIDHPSAKVVCGSFSDPAVCGQLLAGEVDILFHLASLPGGAAEQDPALGKAVNLDGSISLIDHVAGVHCPIVVYTSSIAALGGSGTTVTDETPLRPSGSYGTHKAMVEYYLADLTRRGVLDARSVRPAGIVARPKGAYAGFATAWMSDIFHAAREHRPVAIPARADSHVWLQSLDTLAGNIIHAALMPAQGLPRHRAWTLPASVVRIDLLVEALHRYTGHAVQITYGNGPTDLPPLDASAGLGVGFISDGDADCLVEMVMSHIERG